MDQPVTALLREFAGGDRTAVDRLMPLLYPGLQKLARGYLRNERKAHTLQPTALVHEAYARLVKQSQPDSGSQRVGHLRVRHAQHEPQPVVLPGVFRGSGASPARQETRGETRTKGS